MDDFQVLATNYLKSPAGFALLLVSVALLYGVALVDSWRFFRAFASSVALERAEIMGLAAAVRNRRRPGRPPKDQELKWFRDSEKEVAAYDIRISETRGRIFQPLAGFASVAFVVAPLVVLALIVLLGQASVYLPALSVAVGLASVPAVSPESALAFLIEGVARTLSFEVADAFHIAGHIYPSHLDAPAYTILAWPLRLTVAAYFYLSVYELYGMARDLRAWVRERNGLAESLREAQAENGHTVQYDGIFQSLRVGWLGFSAASTKWSGPESAPAIK